MSENRLARETSPYLLQHKDNPVHWWAWGPEALAEAKRTGKPILLSVGYAACHWCHVMAHESFEDDGHRRADERAVRQHQGRPRGASRHRRHLHARAARLGEQGGWPLTMFLDSEARPFWGGTYFPPEPRFGRPSFQHVLTEVARIYREEPDKISHNAGMLVQALSEREHERRRAQHHGRGTRRSHRPHGQRRRHAPRRPLRRAEVSAVELLLAAVARRHPLRRSDGAAGRRHHAHQHLPGRHLRSPGRRLRALLGRRALAGAALREDALRQRAAHRPDERGLPRDRQRALQGRASRRPSTGCSAR